MIWKIYRIPKCDFNKVAKQLYWNCTLAWMFSRKLAVYSQNTFFQEHLWMAPSEINTKTKLILAHVFQMSVLDVNKRNKKPHSSVYCFITWIFQLPMCFQKQPSKSAFCKRCSENMQQIYRTTPMAKRNKCDFNKVAKQLLWNLISTWVLSCKFAGYFQNTFYKEHLWMAASVYCCCYLDI